MDWFLYDNGLRHERVNISAYSFIVIYDYYKCTLSQPEKKFDYWNFW